MEKEQISKTVDCWIAVKDLPSRSGLKVVKRFDAYEGMDEDEIEAYMDFRSWYMNKEHALLLTIPKPNVERDFWPEPDDALSFAYGSMDFQKLRGKFNKNRYRISKILERVKDLAENFSCINHEQGKKNVRKRYEELINDEFRDKAIELAVTYNRFKASMDYDEVMGKIKNLYILIKKCDKVWKKHACE